jgi:hypothetical protein
MSAHSSAAAGENPAHALECGVEFSGRVDQLRRRTQLRQPIDSAHKRRDILSRDGRGIDGMLWPLRVQRALNQAALQRGHIGGEDEFDEPRPVTLGDALELIDEFGLREELSYVYVVAESICVPTTPSARRRA